MELTVTVRDENGNELFTRTEEANEERPVPAALAAAYLIADLQSRE